MTGGRFTKKMRIRKHREFGRVYGRRRSAGDGLLLIHGCENRFDYPRLGLTVSRKVGGAVLRNRWKRIVREAFRRSQDELPKGVDLVVTPRPGAEPDLAAVRRSLTRLVKQIERRLAADRRATVRKTR